MTNTSSGIVSLIGSGPGDPELITAKGIQRLRNAEIVFHDKLSPLELVDRYCHEDIVVRDVGKRKGKVGPSQAEINDMLVEASRDYDHVVRLKGGDPYVFGRGGEEASYLQQHDVNFEVIPGISSLQAVPNYAGVPATERHHSSSLAVITGHLGNRDTELPWDALADIDTLVVMMGITRCDTIADNLISSGKNPDTPVAVIGWGTTPEQSSLDTSLEALTSGLDNESNYLPGLIVIGEVVEYRDALNWYEQRPLFGKRIVVTRPEEQNQLFADRLRQLGARPLKAPTIEITPRDDGLRELRETFNSLKEYDWLVFTSKNGVRFFFDELESNGLDTRALGHLNTATIGRATADELKKHGCNADVVPKQFQAEYLAKELLERSGASTSYLLPRAGGARDVLKNELREDGHRVSEIPTYESVPATNTSRDQFRSWIGTDQVDMITFTSASTVDSLFEMFESHTDELHNWLSNVSIATIGPITARRLKSRDISVDVIPDQYTIDHLVGAIESHYRQTESTEPEEAPRT